MPDIACQAFFLFRIILVNACLQAKAGLCLDVIASAADYFLKNRERL
jgi:hypothetical protein